MEITYTSGGKLRTIVFDGHLREQHDGSAQVTEHAVEKGSPVADHIRTAPDRLTIDAVVTNTPITIPESNLDGASGSVRDLDVTIQVKGELPVGVPLVGALVASAGLLDSTTTVKAQTLQFDQPFDRARSVYDEIQEIYSSGTLVDISTSIRDYTDMAIESVSVPRTVDTAGSLEFSISTKTLRFAETQTVPAPKDKGTTTGKKNLGQKPATDGGDQSSVLYKLIHGGG